MITDKPENVHKYQNIPYDVREFIAQLNSDIPIGRYKINNTDYANIDIYETKPYKDCYFEAHKNYIDIQIMLKGEEFLEYTDTKGLAVREPYDPKRDVMFFENSKKADSIKLVPGIFVYLDTCDAHKPQMCIDEVPNQVKKAVIKIMVK